MASPLRSPRRDRVRRRADELTRDITEPPIPVRELVETHGAEVVFTTFGTCERTISGLCHFPESTIHVNVKDSAERQRFTMAHELGHWLLHKELYGATRAATRCFPASPRRTRTAFRKRRPASSLPTS